jgi:hypothetical protein
MRGEEEGERKEVFTFCCLRERERESMLPRASYFGQNTCLLTSYQARTKHERKAVMGKREKWGAGKRKRKQNCHLLLQTWHTFRPFSVSFVAVSSLLGHATIEKLKIHRS